MRRLAMCTPMGERGANELIRELPNILVFGSGDIRQELMGVIRDDDLPCDPWEHAPFLWHASPPCHQLYSMNACMVICVVPFVNHQERIPSIYGSID
jgi:hypothetical protein